MISFNQSCNRQCKDCKVYSICSIRHVVQINQEQNSNNLNCQLPPPKGRDLLALIKNENANKERDIIK